MNFNVTLLPGDGVGPEVIDSAVAVLHAVERRFGHDFHMHPMPIGGNAIDVTGVPLPPETLTACNKSDAVLLGAVGGPKWNDLKAHMRPEKGLLSLRAGMKLFANLRPAVLYDELIPTSPLRPDLAKKGVDIMIVRELTGGIYFGDRGYRDGALGQEAYDTEVYSINEVERIAKIAFELAMTRKKRITSVDKSNVLETSRLWRATVDRVAKGYPEVKVEHMLVDNCAMQLVKNPSQFDLILTSNMFGDILSDEAAAITGSIGMLPSSSLGAGNIGLVRADTRLRARHCGQGRGQPDSDDTRRGNDAQHVVKARQRGDRRRLRGQEGARQRLAHQGYSQRQKARHLLAHDRRNRNQHTQFVKKQNQINKEI